MAKPGDSLPAFAGSSAQLVYGHVAARLRTADYAPGFRHWIGPPDRHVNLAQPVPGLLALSCARHSRVHGVHVVVLPIAVRRLHSNALSEIVGRSIDHASPARTCGV